MCQLYAVSVSGYYAWRERAPSERATRDAVLVEKIRQEHVLSRESYGSPRVHAALGRQGEQVGSASSGAADAGTWHSGPLRGVVPTDARHGPVLPAGGRLDRYSRRLLGWSLGLQRTSALTRRAFRRALASRKPGDGAIFHSDRGVEYLGYDFQRQLDTRLHSALGYRTPIEFEYACS